MENKLNLKNILIKLNKRINEREEHILKYWVCKELDFRKKSSIRIDNSRLLGNNQHS